MVIKNNISVNEGTPVEDIHFELPRGFEIAGVVTDVSGKPITNAQVQANAISSRNPIQVTTLTDRTGRFEALGLVEGHYVLAVSADGFVKDEKKPVASGERNAHVVLEEQGGVHVVVRGRNGTPLRAYELELKSYFPQSTPSSGVALAPGSTGGSDPIRAPASAAPPPTGAQAFGRVPGKHPIRVTNARDGEYHLTGLDPGSYVLQVMAQNHAKNYSDPFTVLLGGDEPRVEVQLAEGGTLIGQVVGTDGRPVAGVDIRTMPNNQDENPFHVMFEALIPVRITQAEVRTDGHGRFKIPLLIPDIYQLRISHSDHYRLNQKDVLVQEGQVTDLGTIQLKAGIRVHGVVFVNGAPTANVEVNVSGGTNGFNNKSLTDQSGRFQTTAPLPPGEYEITASRSSLSNPFLKIADYQRSRKKVTLFEGNQVQDVSVEIIDSNPEYGR
jgi:hypothetical protein